MSSGVAKILIGNPNLSGVGRAHAGMGIVLDQRRVLTCAHVVNRALNLDFASQERPLDHVALTFPLLNFPKEIIILASIDLWRPMGSDADSDIAILELQSDTPSKVGFATFRSGALRPGDTLYVYGIPGTRTAGNNAVTRFSGLVDGSLGQLDGGPWTQAFIESGYSGAGVRDIAGRIVGMTTARDGGDQDIAFMIPADTIIAVAKPTVAPPDTLIADEIRAALTDFIRFCSLYASTFIPLLIVVLSTIWFSPKMEALICDSTSKCPPPVDDIFHLALLLWCSLACVALAIISFQGMTKNEAK